MIEQQQENKNKRKYKKRYLVRVAEQREAEKAMREFQKTLKTTEGINDYTDKQSNPPF
jgi:hypothetical protein